MVIIVMKSSFDQFCARSHTIAGYRDSRYERDDMSETWQRWEGRTIDGRFPLRSYLGGSDHSAVFLTLKQGGAGDSGKAAIKLIPADPADAEKRLLRWEAASEMSHPNLIRIFEAGRCELDGTELLYAVEECAEENLSQILPERALTAEETRGMLPPILRALQHVHDLGFVHGHIQPSNILATGDQVKLSSDALATPDASGNGARPTSAYDPPEAATGAVSTATDVWQLGMTLVEVLTQSLPAWNRARPSVPAIPAAVPEPFREIAERCLQVDREKRWTIAEISDWLEGKGRKKTSVQPEKAVFGAPIASPQQASKKWSYLLALAAAAALAFFLIPRPKPPGPKLEGQPTQPEQSVASQPASQSTTTPEPKPSPPATPAATEQAKAGHTKVGGATPEVGDDEKMSADAKESGVVQRVMPQVSPSARRTIHGTIKVRVKVEVDAAGNVAMATLESGGPSKYFSRLALEAARGWKFSPAQATESGAREWKLQFAYSRAKTEASAVRFKR